MVEELAELARVGAATLVGAVATDAWASARAGFVRLFGRGGQRRGELVTVRLDGDSQALTTADPSHLGVVRADMEANWRLRLGDLLEEDPEAAEQLRDLLREIQELSPATVAGVANQTGPVTGVGGQGAHGQVVFGNSGVVGNVTFGGGTFRQGV